MPGLLDFLNTDDGKLGVALLAAAGPSMQPMGFGQRLQGAMQSLQTDKLEQAKMGLLGAQLAETKAQADQRQQALQLAQRKQAALPGILGIGGGTASPGPIQPQSVGGVSMFSQPLGVGQVPQQSASGINVAAALQAGFTPDEIAKLDSLRNLGKDKVARTIKSTGSDGREYETQYDEFGRAVGSPLAQYRAPLSVNQGNKTTYLDPYSLSPLTSMQTFQSPDSAASVAATMRGQNMTDARARESNANARIPSGYRQTDGGLEFIPGGPADPATAKRAAPTEFQGKSTTFAARMQDAAKTIDSLQSEVSPSQVARAGYSPQFPSWVPGGQIAAAGIAAANRELTPEKAQMFRQAQENWVTANLRQESGAAIGKEEMEKDIKKWFPQPGEPASVIEQKAKARKVAERAMVVQAGPGAASIEGIVNGDGSPPVQTSAASSGVQWRYVNGKLQKVQ